MTGARHSESIFKKVLKEIFLLCTVFFIEVSLVRHFVNMDSSVPIEPIVVPALCALAALSYVTAGKMPLEFSFQKKTLVLNLLFYVPFFIFNIKMEPLVLSLGWPVFAGLWFGFAVLALGSSFFVFVKPSSIYRKLKSYPVETAFGILAGLAQVLYELINQRFWRWYLSIPTIGAVRGLLRLFGVHTESTNPREIAHPLFTVHVGTPCSGLEGVAFFVFVFSVLAILDWKKHSPRKLFALFTGGTLFMLVLNLLRITVFFLIALWITIQFGKSEGSQWFVWAFHAHIGWIFYLIGIGIFLVSFFILPSKKREGDKNGGL